MPRGPSQPRIIDCTLREGCQALQCSFDVQQSERLAQEISRFGVDMIECGHPFISSAEVDRVRAVVQASSVPVLAHARCRPEDIDAVAASGAPWVGIFASVNEISLATKFKTMTKDDVFGLFARGIAHARGRGLRVRATIEDAGRTAISDIVRLIQVGRAGGADRMCFADSVGMLTPRETYDVLSLLKHEFPDVTFEYHVHNDLGLALANSIEALHAGVEWFSTSCNGIGERAGITDTFQFATVLDTRYDQRRFNLRRAKALSERVALYSRILRSPMQPIVGENAFVHVARLHQLAVQENINAYNIIDPELIGGKVALSKDPPILSLDPFITPFEKSATELRHHREGPGTRFVMLDRRLFATSPFYFIARKVDGIGSLESGHVDRHVHVCDSVFMFLGAGEGYRGLEVEVEVGAQVRRMVSPASVFVPAGVGHTYRFISGSGTFINFVNRGDYNQSLMETEPS